MCHGSESCICGAGLLWPRSPRARSPKSLKKVVTLLWFRLLKTVPRTPADVQARPARRFGSLVPLSAGHAYASLADARSSFGDNGGGGDGAPQRLISAWSSLRSTISSRPQRVFNAFGHLIANEGYDEGKRLSMQL